ncbi:undecaprenyl-diphosphate phosphatase [Paenibacillus sp. SC116]|uniref:undecaprenyl-diphosphate phosphatase n=1 Tax=Paenibacillus sp. SC116 TaxID=2968986 RepID=UPI00215B4903|nr:undecaprenyl-diphosphate phosphatase [Paenibacillus sp. SC116]MCR8843689.1 undecaprenyl-diphosphate phosphatase [Paenibacillus sp. SC116]
MLTVFIAVILGVVEGLTEFIPVSSTGHMILTASFIGLDEHNPLLKTFMIMIQLGAILAITIVYRGRLLTMLRLRPVTVARGAERSVSLNLFHVALGILPALVVAFFAKDFIKSLFSASTVMWALVVGGIFMWLAESFSSKREPTAHTIDQITYKQALLIGVYQIISVLWPGFSRSGSTISGGLLSGVSYRASADFSFLIAIPIMIAATGYELLSNYQYISGDGLAVFLLGFIVSFIVAYIVVISFLKYIQAIKLKYFAIYRFVLAGLFWFIIMY